jgi:hypothetical protein
MLPRSPVAHLLLGFFLAALPVRAADAGKSAPALTQAAVDSLLDAERYDEAIAAARAALPNARNDAAVVALRSSLMLAYFQKGDLRAPRTERGSVVACAGSSSHRPIRSAPTT